MREIIKDNLTRLYGTRIGSDTFNTLAELIDKWKQILEKKFHGKQKCPLSNKSVFLITYGDQVNDDAHPTLRVLYEVSRKYLRDLVDTIHILPFYPYSSDDGFSVIDYYSVNPELGNWEDVEALSKDFSLMFDGVFNHISAKSDWFKGFLEGNTRYRDFFIVPNNDMDLSRVVRPRTSPLLTEFATKEGTKFVWTTFSANQIDLNYKNPEVLLQIIDVLLFYVSKGASYIRLDAIAYLWKESRTGCINLPQTHYVIQILRAVLDEIAPWTRIITETNVPHNENISYFGNGSNEAHLVYNFTLPPLLLYSMLSGNAAKLTNWAKSINLPAGDVCFLNYLASHDGIGVMPLSDILNNKELDFLTNAIIERKGFISYKSISDGGMVPYELNINYLDALAEPESNSLETAIKRFIIAHAIMMSMSGIPAIYFHSLFGSRGDLEGAIESGIPRRINREKLKLRQFLKEMQDWHSIRYRIYEAIKSLIKERKKTEALNPFNKQVILDAGAENFALLRIGEKENFLGIFNISGKQCTIKLILPTNLANTTWIDSFTKNKFRFDHKSNLEIKIQPYNFYWMRNFLD